MWNVNSSNGVIAAFNLQGASWSRKLRKYDIHDTQPDKLSATVCPCDVPTFKVRPYSCPSFCSTGAKQAPKSTVVPSRATSKL